MNAGRGCPSAASVILARSMMRFTIVLENFSLFRDSGTFRFREMDRFFFEVFTSTITISTALFRRCVSLWVIGGDKLRCFCIWHVPGGRRGICACLGISLNCCFLGLG